MDLWRHEAYRALLDRVPDATDRARGAKLLEVAAAAFADILPRAQVAEEASSPAKSKRATEPLFCPFLNGERLPLVGTEEAAAAIAVSRAPADVQPTSIVGNSPPPDGAWEHAPNLDVLR